MALLDTLITWAEGAIAIQESGTANRREEVKQVLRDAAVFDPNGLKIFSKNAAWLEEIALEVKGHETELGRFVTVNGAAFGMLGVWNQILAVWVMTPWPQDPFKTPEEIAAGKATVKKFILDSVTNYTRAIAK